MIQIRQLHKSYHTEALSLHVLKGIDLNIEAGEYVSIMGASGSGKSTLLNILGILDTYDARDYHLNGSLIRNLSEKQAAKYRNEMIGFVFQSFNLINFKNALENVALPLYYKKVSRKKRNIIAMEHLDRMGLKEWAHHLPNELSGGQKQRVAIARAMISNPKVILADEPTGALDSKTTEEVMEVLTNLNSEGITTIIVTHERSVADATRRIIHLKDGMIEYETRKENGIHETIPSLKFSSL
ncbi:MAG: ABC transporter ATP-binding protein [Proteiniphilum sp.]|jgi:putative ABC transport system ATP-binding protein